MLTGGASAVYGADAVAGVVNFVLNTHFEGVKIDADYGFGRYQNNHSDLLADLAAADDQIPASTVDAGANKDIYCHWRVRTLPTAKAMSLFMRRTYKSQPAVGYQYDFAGCSLNTPSTLPGPGNLKCGGSGTPATGRFALFGVNSATGKFGQLTGTYAVQPNGIFSPYTAADSYNYGALSYLQRAA